VVGDVAVDEQDVDSQVDDVVSVPLEFVLLGLDGRVEVVDAGDVVLGVDAGLADLDIVADEGRANSIDRHGEDSTETDLIRQDRDEAYADLGLFDYTVVSYQTRATEREFCHNCGRDAETIVRRHDEKVLRIFGLTVSTSERTATDECPNCTPYVTDDEVELTESERRDIFG